MRIFFLILVLAHGLVHLLGFVKAFGLAPVKQLILPISKPLGILWLIACVLLLTTGILFLFKTGYWWWVALVAGFISQVLITYFWRDARYGTFVNIVILLAGIHGGTAWNYKNKYTHDVQRALEVSPYFPDSLVTEADLQRLPEPVRIYLRVSGCVGQPKVNNFKVKFSGKIRKNEQSDWMPFISEQYNFMKEPARFFFMNARMKGLPVGGYHHFENGKAYMDIRLLSTFRVQYQDGVEMDQSETVTFFNDMCCLAPATLIDNRIEWENADGNKVKASFTTNGIRIAAWLYFNERGELINFISDDRYAADARRKLPWETPLKEYQDIQGHHLMRTADVLYHYTRGKEVYGMFELLEVTYNVKTVQ
jgi:hypothetical protein